MKFLKKRTVAIAVMVAAILLSCVIGIAKKPMEQGTVMPPTEQGMELDTSLNTNYFRQYVVDEADVLSSQAEEQISVYNANWDTYVGSIMAVVTIKETVDGVEAAAWEWAEMLQLGENDAILLIDAWTQDYIVVASGTFYDALAAQSGSFVDMAMQESVGRGDYAEGVLRLCEMLHPQLTDNVIHITLDGGGEAFAAVLGIILLIAVLVLVFSIMDDIRFSGWNARYGRMATPVVVYRPILWWHRPGSAWYRRRRNPPIMPGTGPRPGPRPPVGGMRPPMGGSTRPPVNGGHRRTPPRSGSFGGGRGGNFGGSSRGGSFGGSRGGGFGGRR